MKNLRYPLVGEKNETPFIGCKISPEQTRFKNFEEKLERKNPKRTIFVSDVDVLFVYNR